MRFACALLCGLLILSCNPFAQQPPRITRPPEPTFRPLVGSDALTLVSKSVTVTYAVAYAMQGDLEGTRVTGSWTTYQRPPQVRLDMVVNSEGGQAMNFRSYIAPDGTIVCQMATPPVCQRAGEAIGPDASATNLLARRPADYTVVTRERLRIAEEQTDCFLFRPNEGIEAAFKEAFICYASDGVPLMVDMDLRDGSSFALEGRIVKRTVTDAEMAAPPVR